MNDFEVNRMLMKFNVIATASVFVFDLFGVFFSSFHRSFLYSFEHYDGHKMNHMTNMPLYQK